MRNVRILIAVILIGAFVCVVAAIVFAASDPISPNCRRACSITEGRAWSDCILLCEQVAR